MEDPRAISRETAVRLGLEAVTISRQRWYIAPSGRRVELDALVANAVSATRSYAPNDSIARPTTQRAHRTELTVRSASTLDAAHALATQGFDVAALNFASAHNPGGGFLSGARAQEESLCRSSALYVCLEGQPMYAWHARRPDPLYASWLVHSPDVAVFRTDEGELLDEPWRCSFITAPAPNAKQLMKREPHRAHEIEPAFAERIERVLALAAEMRHDALVLGAWGCGAFGCDAGMVADQFAQALEGAFDGVFARVTFAVLDTTPERRFIGPFEERLRA